MTEADLVLAVVLDSCEIWPKITSTVQMILKSTVIDAITLLIVFAGVLGPDNFFSAG